MPVAEWQPTRCGQLSVLARHTHMLHCPSVPISSWKLCIDRPQFAVCLGSSSVFDSVLLPWRLLLGLICHCGGVLGWVRMLPTPASMLPQSMHPSSGPQWWHLASPEPPCCRVYGTTSTTIRSWPLRSWAIDQSMAPTDWVEYMRRWYTIEAH